MPLNSPEDYDRLGEHLAEIDVPLATFAAQHGYIVYPKFSGGRYPNRRMTRDGHLFRSIVIQMDLTLSGERYEKFFPDIPYTIWGGTWIDDAKKGTRWFGPSIRIEFLPFSRLTATLHQHLAHFDGYLSRVTESYIMANGRTGPLRLPT